MKTIPLTQGKVTVVSDRDYPRIKAMQAWCDFNGWRIVGKFRAERYKRTWYAACDVRFEDGRGRTYKLHRLILNLTPDDPREGDHRNGDGLDNRRSNLRVVTLAQNRYNKRLYKNNTSGYKGVRRSGQKWRAIIGVDGGEKHLGSFATKIEAARAYDVAALKHHGRFARLNFPQGRA